MSKPEKSPSYGRLKKRLSIKRACQLSPIDTPRTAQQPSLTGLLESTASSVEKVLCMRRFPTADQTGAEENQLAHLRFGGPPCTTGFILVPITLWLLLRLHRVNFMPYLPVLPATPNLSASSRTASSNRIRLDVSIRLTETSAIFPFAPRIPSCQIGGDYQQTTTSPFEVIPQGCEIFSIRHRALTLICTTAQWPIYSMCQRRTKA